jgi:hypothetical protein
MNFQEALKVVQQVQNDWQLPGLLETMEFIRDNEDECTYNVRRAFGVVFREMGKLFAPA